MGFISKEIVKAGRGAGTDKPFFLGITENIKYGDTEESPLTVISDKSGFAIKFTGGGESVSGFISIKDFPMVNRLTQCAVNVLAQKQMRPSVQAGPVWRFKFVASQKREAIGKTPAEALSLGLLNADDMEVEIQSLEKNKAKFSTNVDGIKAIKEALSGNSVAVAEEALSPLIIYSTGVTHYWNDEKDGYRTGIDLDITMNPNDKTPFKVVISNSKVKVANNRLVEKKEIKTRSTNLSLSEWTEMVDKMNMIKTAAELPKLIENLKTLL